ncbi:MAG: LysM peptidoglycan-binding domain-containing protein [Chloroflexota bacterium]
MAVGLAGWQFLAGPLFNLPLPFSSPATAQPTITLMPPSPTALPTINPTATITASSPEITETPLTPPTATNTPLPLSSPTPGPPLGVPFGNEPKFVIHQVTEGESLVLIANIYGTTQEAIQAVNFWMPSPLWSGWYVVVPINTFDTSGLPSFEVYIVANGGISVETLAADLKTNIDDLRYYNALGDGATIPQGRWLLIPRAQKTQP